ncbi:hypothetical protein FVE85_3367 [Porphyridium purpureum]|uniref:Uncharacterized protein n=1 Tax=Porphyridium purpureum TaxID=35688 RepID=A0A5J4YUU7_PORPP|nr:hypothetical protein FVE85_3367 [Porphyridium purpureum]|eukprot:POR5427..scf227_4
METLPKIVQAHILSVVGPHETIVGVHHPTKQLVNKKANMNYIVFIVPAAWLLCPLFIYRAEFERKKLGRTYYVVTDEALYTIIMDMDERGKFAVTNGNSLSRVPYDHVIMASVDTPGKGCTCMQVPHASVQTAGFQSRHTAHSETNAVEPAGEWMLVEDPHALVMQINDAMRARKAQDRQVGVEVDVKVSHEAPAPKRVFVSSSRNPDDVRFATIRDDMDDEALKRAIGAALGLAEDEQRVQQCEVKLMYAPDRYSMVSRAADIRDDDTLLMVMD